MASDDLAEIVLKAAEALKLASIPYMLVGSTASSYHGRPRTTQDIDILIDPTAESLKLLLEQFDDPQRFYVNRETAIRSLQLQSLFNIIEYNTGWKLDFIILKKEPFYLEEFSRRMPVKLYGTELSMSSAEDVVISKLLWAKMSESDRQIRDVRDVLQTQANKLDMSYLEKWIAELALDRQWKKALAS